MIIRHHYDVSLTWTGNRGSGTSGYKAYGREHIVSVAGKEPIAGSADRAFFGDVERWNPEDLLVAALSQCHMLSYLAQAALSGLLVTEYQDSASGTMEQTPDGGGHFTRVVLRPRVTVMQESMVELARQLHSVAAQKCFIAASVNFPVEHEPVVTLAQTTA